MRKPDIAMYWASSCGGCEVALLNLHGGLLEFADTWNFVYCPCLLDTKSSAIKALPDNSLDVTLFNGAIRNDENLEMAHELRRASRILVAFGSCAHEGCVPGLSNLHTVEEHFVDIYLDPRFTDNPAQITPKPCSQTPFGDLHLPRFHERVTTLADHVPVDFIIPGCPPEPHRISELLVMLANRPEPAGAAMVTGGGTSTVCAECPRSRSGAKTERLRRIHEYEPDRKQCLLEQGVVCLGVATRDGCGALCPGVNMPCSGCYGVPEGVADQGGAMVSALAAVLACGDIAPQDQVAGLESALAGLPDPAGRLYAYSLAASLLKGKRP